MKPGNKTGTLKSSVAASNDRNEQFQGENMSINPTNLIRHAATELDSALRGMTAALSGLEQHIVRDEAHYYIKILHAELERVKLAAAQLAPLPRVESSKPAATSTAGIIENPDGQKDIILIIDDEELNLLFVKETLKAAGYRVIGCINPFLALDIYKQFKDSIALVILDYTLPIINGAEVFAELRALNPNVAVMLSSGYSEQEDVKAMLSAGLRGFLPKPYTEDKLLSHVKASLDSLKPVRSARSQ